MNTQSVPTCGTGETASSPNSLAFSPDRDPHREELGRRPTSRRVAPGAIPASRPDPAWGVKCLRNLIVVPVVRHLYHSVASQRPARLVDRFSRVTGEILRRARLERGLTLNDVRDRSVGRFKPSLLGGYERGERSISLERFFELAVIYGVPADLLAKDVVTALHGDVHPVVIDLNRLSSVKGAEAQAIAEFVHGLRAQRGDYLSDVISLRSGDFEARASALGLKPRKLHAKLRPALRPTNRKATPPGRTKS